MWSAPPRRTSPRPHGSWGARSTPMGASDGGPSRSPLWCDRAPDRRRIRRVARRPGRCAGAGGDAGRRKGVQCPCPRLALAETSPDVVLDGIPMPALGREQGMSVIEAMRLDHPGVRLDGLRLRQSASQIAVGATFGDQREDAALALAEGLQRVRPAACSAQSLDDRSIDERAAAGHNGQTPPDTARTTGCDGRPMAPRQAQPGRGPARPPRRPRTPRRRAPLRRTDESSLYHGVGHRLFARLTS